MKFSASIYAILKRFLQKELQRGTKSMVLSRARIARAPDFSARARVARLIFSARARVVRARLIFSERARVACTRGWVKKIGKTYFVTMPPVNMN